MRISKKVVFEYLESVYPDWKTFEEIVDEIPVMFNFDMFELQNRLDRLCIEKKIEKEFSDEELIGTLEWQRYRISKKYRGEK